WAALVSAAGERRHRATLGRGIATRPVAEHHGRGSAARGAANAWCAELAAVVAAQLGPVQVTTQSAIGMFLAAGGHPRDRPTCANGSARRAPDWSRPSATATTSR